MLKSKNEEGLPILDLRQMKHQGREIAEKIAILDL